MEPSNQKSQMDQEYGLLPADAAQQQVYARYGQILAVTLIGC